MRAAVALTFIVLGMAASTEPENPDAILGQWLTSKGEARIEIYKDGGHYAGKIVWMEETVYPEDDPEAGKVQHDRENPDPAKRDRPMIGLQLLREFDYVGGHAWKNGVIYNPDNGKTYNANLSLAKNGSLKVHGYIGFSLLGGTTVWTRVDIPANLKKVVEMRECP